MHAQMPLKNRVGMSARTGDLGKTKQCSKIFLAIRTTESVGNISGLASCQVWEAGSGWAIVVQTPEEIQGGNTQCDHPERKSL